MGFTDLGGELMHYHSIPHKLVISTNMRNEVIPLNLRDGFMMHHLILEWIDSPNQTLPLACQNKLLI